MNYSFADGPVFGYDMETNTVKGYDEANWLDPAPKISFGYDIEDNENKLFGFDKGYWS